MTDANSDAQHSSPFYWERTLVRSDDFKTPIVFFLQLCSEEFPSRERPIRPELDVDQDYSNCLLVNITQFCGTVVIHVTEFYGDRLCDETWETARNGHVTLMD